MQMLEYVSTGGVIALVGFVWKLARDGDSKVSRLYGRLDETKKANEETYTRKDLCELQHKQVNENFDRVKETLGEMKLDIKEIKNILNNGKE